MSDFTFLQYQLSQLCQNAIETCPFTNPVAGADCSNKFCHGFPAYLSVGTCVTLNYDPENCCQSSNPTACLQNFAHGSGGSGSSSTNVCASAIAILDTCFTLTPALSPTETIATSGPSATALASCVCYDKDGTYDPMPFDGFASDCQASGSAVHPTYFPIVTPLVGLCTNFAGAAAAASTTPPALTTPPASSPAAVGSSAPVSSAAVAGSTAIPTSAGKTTETLTSAGTETTAVSSSTAVSAATTTASKSGGVKITLRSGAILLLGLSMLFSFQ